MPPKVIHIRDAPALWETNPLYVYIGRKGHGQDGYFGNPYPLVAEHLRSSCIEAFRTYCRHRIQVNPEYHRRVKALLGKTLVCFCKPKACHGDVLAEECEKLNHVGNEEA